MEESAILGAVLELRPNLRCLIRLDDGEEVRARVDKRAARVMWKLVPGDRVRIEIQKTGEYVVRGFAPTPS